MASNDHVRRHSEDESVLRKVWPQARPEIRRHCEKAGPGKREGSRLLDRRRGACHPQSLEQSPADRRGKTRAAGRLYGRAPLQLAAALLAFLVAGCGGAPKHTARSTVPRDVPPPAVTHPTVPTDANGEIVVPKNAKPIYTETGRASWYGPRFQNRHAANGEIFDMNQLTAAPPTIPLNSIARVTNVKTTQTDALRLTAPS